MSSEDARRTALIEKERLRAKEIVPPVAIGMGMTPELRQRRQHVTDGTTARQADGSPRAVLECPTLPVSLAHGERTWLAAMGALVGRLDEPFQLVVQRRGRHLSGASAADDETSRLRDSYERLLADRWPDRPQRGHRFVMVVLERQAPAAGEALLAAGIETVRVPADRMSALAATPDLEELRSEVRLAGHLGRPLRITECPTLVAADWLAVLRATDADLDVSLHVWPQALASAGQRMVAADLLVTVWAADRVRLDEATRALERALSGRLVRIRRCAFDAEPAFISGRPLGHPGGRRLFPLRTLTSLLSCVWGGDADRDRGLLVGVEPGAGRPLLLDRYALTNRSSLVLGATDADQLSVLKVEVARARVAGAAVTVIDTRGELAAFVEALGGEVIRLDPGAAGPFDAFAVAAGRQGALSARIACLTAVIELLAGGLGDHQAGALEHALSYAFAARGHTDDGDAAVPPSPTARDVLGALESQSARAFGEVKAQIDALAHVVSTHATGLLAGAGHRQPSVPLLACDLSGVPDDQRPAAALLALDHACCQAPDDAPRLVVVDEVAPLVRLPHAAGHLVRLAERGGVGLRLATADVSRLLAGPARRLVASDHLKLLLRQAPDAMPALAELLHLTPAEQSWLLAARPAEGLLVTPDQRLAFALAMTDEEQRLITGGATR